MQTLFFAVWIHFKALKNYIEYLGIKNHLFNYI